MDCQKYEKGIKICMKKKTIEIYSMILAEIPSAPREPIAPPQFYVRFL